MTTLQVCGLSCVFLSLVCWYGQQYRSRTVKDIQVWNGLAVFFGVLVTIIALFT